MAIPGQEYGSWKLTDEARKKVPAAEVPAQRGVAGEQIELSVVMPCLNEHETAGVCGRKAVAALRQAGISGEVILADNGSTDGSVEIAQAEGARVVRIAEKGYGNALKGGILATSGQYVLMADSDDSYDFSHILRNGCKENDVEQQPDAAGVDQYVSDPLSKLHGYTWKYALEAAEKSASADHAPVLICSDRPESSSAPMPAIPKNRVMFSPLPHYKVSVPVAPLPRALNQDAVQIATPFLMDAQQRRQRFLAVGFIGSYETFYWLSQASQAYRIRQLDPGSQTKSSSSNSPRCDETS